MVQNKKKTAIISLSHIPKNNAFIPKTKAAAADLKSHCKITGWFTMTPGRPPKDLVPVVVTVPDTTSINNPTALVQSITVPTIALPQVKKKRGPYKTCNSTETRALIAKMLGTDDDDGKHTFVCYCLLLSILLITVLFFPEAGY